MVLAPGFNFRLMVKKCIKFSIRIRFSLWAIKCKSSYFQRPCCSHILSLCTWTHQIWKNKEVGTSEEPVNTASDTYMHMMSTTTYCVVKYKGEGWVAMLYFWICPVQVWMVNMFGFKKQSLFWFIYVTRKCKADLFNSHLVLHSLISDL